MWKLLQGGENDFDVVVYNSLTVDPESETFDLFRAKLMYRSTGGASNHRMVRTATWSAGDDPRIGAQDASHLGCPISSRGMCHDRFMAEY